MQNHSHLKEFSRYVSLNVLGMLGLSCYILADTFFIARGLGANGLTALNLAIPIYSLIHGSALMLGMGGSIRYSILKSQNQKDAGNAAFTHTLVLALCLGILFSFAGLFFTKQITALTGADSAVFQMTETYLKLLLLCAPAFLLNELLLCFVRNDHAPHLAMLAMITGSLSNIVLDYIFIFPLHLGIFGAVLATCMAPVISMMILSPFFLTGKNHFHLTRCRYSAGLCGYILAGGIPSLVTELSSGIVILIFNFILLSLQGNIGVAAYGIIANLSLVIISVYTGVAQGIQPVLSRYYGMRQPADIQKIVRYAFVTILVMSAVIYAGITGGSDFIAALFNSEGNEQLQKTAVYGMKLYFTGCLFAGLNIVLSAYYTSTDLAAPAGILSLLRGFLVIIPLSFLLSFFWDMTGLWLAFPVTELTVTMLFLPRAWHHLKCPQQP